MRFILGSAISIIALYGRITPNSFKSLTTMYRNGTKPSYLSICMSCLFHQILFSFCLHEQKRLSCPIFYAVSVLFWDKLPFSVLYAGHGLTQVMCRSTCKMCAVANTLCKLIFTVNWTLYTKCLRSKHLV